jgi:hypothetical protein
MLAPVKPYQFPQRTSPADASTSAEAMDTVLGMVVVGGSGGGAEEKKEKYKMPL